VFYLNNALYCLIKDFFRNRSSAACFGGAALFHLASSFQKPFWLTSGGRTAWKTKTTAAGSGIMDK